MSLLFLPYSPKPDFHPEGNQTVIWPNLDPSGHSINVRSPDGLRCVKYIDPATLLSGVDEDQIARTIEASIGQLEKLKGLESLSFLTQNDLPAMSRSEHRPGQRFSLDGTDVIVIFNTSKRIAGLTRGSPETNTYLDIGAVVDRAVVDYSTTQAKYRTTTLRHSGDQNYTIGSHGTKPGPGEKPNEPKLIHFIKATCTEFEPIHLVVAGYSNIPLNRFVGGGVLTFFTPRHLYNVIIDFPEAVFLAVGEAGPVSCAVATIRRNNRGLVVDIAIPGSVLGNHSAPFTKTLDLNESARRVALPLIVTPVSLKSQPSEPIKITHRIDCETCIQVEITPRRAACYETLMESLVPEGPVHLLCVNDELLVPITGSSRLEDVKQAIRNALAAEGHRSVDLGPPSNAQTGQHLSQNLLKKMLKSAISGKRPIHLCISGVPLLESSGSTLPLTIGTHITPDASNATSDVSNATSVLLWTGVEPDHPMRAHIQDLVDSAGSQIQELHAYSGVSTDPVKCGGIVHLPVALCGREGLRGNSALQAVTPWSGYVPEQALSWFSGRNLIIAGTMTPDAAACAGQNRCAGVFVMTTDNIAPFRVMASPASVLLRLCPKDPTLLEWIDGVQEVLPGLNSPGDMIPVRTVVCWALGQVGWDLPSMIPRLTTVGPAGELRSLVDDGVFICPQGVCDARALADLFLQSDVIPPEVSDLRTVGVPNCHEIEAELRRAGRRDGIKALHTVVQRLMKGEPPSPTGLLDQMRQIAGEDLIGDLGTATETVVLRMRITALAHRQRVTEWMTLRYQMAWFGGSEAKQYVIDHLTNGRFSVGPTPPESTLQYSPINIQEIVSARRKRIFGRPTKLLTLLFDPTDVRTITQLTIQKGHVDLKNAAQQAKALRVGANVDTVQQWEIGDLADHIDVLCGDLGRCAFFSVDIMSLSNGQFAGLVQMQPTIGTADVAALMEIPAARPINVSEMLPVLNGHALGTDLYGEHMGGICLCLPIADEAARAETPWPDIQMRSVQPEGDGLFRIALIRGLEPFLPDLGERRATLRHLFECVAQEACHSAMDSPGEYTLQVARGMVLRLLCLWASGQSPLSWVFQMAQPNGMDNLPNPQEWKDVSILMDLWPGTGWPAELLRNNLACLVGKVIQRSIQPFITRVQRDRSKKMINAPHTNDHVFMSSNHVKDSLCGNCHKIGPMTRGQRRRSCRHKRIKQCINCCRGLASFNGHPQYQAWESGELKEIIANKVAPGETVEEVERPDHPAPTAELIMSVADDSVFWRIVIPVAERQEVDPLRLVCMFAKDLYAEPNATTYQKNQLACKRFV
jgi:hypothetical protein